MFPFKAEFDRANGMLEGLVEQRTCDLLELTAEVGDATVVAKTVTGGDIWHATKFWLHVVSRRTRCVPCGTDDGPELSPLDVGRIMLLVTVEG